MRSDELPASGAAGAQAGARRARRAWPRRRVRSVLGAVAVLAVVAYIAKELIGSGTEMSRAGDLLSQATLGWIAVAVLCEALSYLAYATAQHRLARACGHRLGVRWLAMLSVAAQAVNNFLPAGYAAANVLNFRELRRRDLSAGSAAWLLVTTSILYVGVLAALALLAAAIPGGRARIAAVDIRLVAAVVLGGGLAFGLLLLMLVRGNVLGRFGRRRVGALARASDRVSEQLRGVALSKRAAAGVASLFLVCWLADATCLLSSFAAIGASPPWRSLPLAYCAAQLVSFVPLTPGGVGLVEGSLTLALVAGGGNAPAALAAVLLYRLVSYWGTLPAGGIGFLAIRRGRRPAAGTAADLSVVAALPALDAGAP